MPKACGRGGINANRSKRVEKSASVFEESVSKDCGDRVICKIDKRIYSCVADDIVSEEVILRIERISHIRDHHPDDYERYGQYIPQMIEHPDYIIETERLKTAFVLKHFEVEENHFRLILRLHTATDDVKYKNSVITFQCIREKEYRRLIRNKKILYKREGL